MAGNGNGSRGLTPKKRPEWTRTFLTRLRDGPNVAAACIAAKTSRQNAYAYRERHPDFAEEWDLAIDVAVDTLAEECFRRATKGVKVDEGIKYADTLAIFLLKCHRPEVYGDKPALHIHADSPEAIAKAIRDCAGGMRSSVPGDAE